MNKRSIFNLVLLLIFSFFTPQNLWSQNSPNEPPASLSESEQKFEIFPDEWTIQGIGRAPFYSFYLGSPKIDGVAFIPNFNPSLGAGISYKGFSIEFTQPIDVLPSYEDARRGSSLKHEFIISSSWHQYAFDIYYQYYRGFYMSTPITSLGDGQPERYAQLPDTEVHNAGANLYYVTSPHQYSLNAAFSHDEFQTQSGGSYIINFFLNRLNMNPGNTFIPGTAPGAQTKPKISSGLFYTLGPALGYGYTYVQNRFFATAQGLIGLGVQYQWVNDYLDDYKRLNLALKLNANLALGVNEKKDLYGIQILLDSIYSQIESSQLASSLVSAQIFYGRRF